MNSRFQNALRNNESTKCVVPGCTKLRHRLGAYCQLHGRKLTLFGHYAARGVIRGKYRQELKECREVLVKNSSHPGVVKALAEIRGFLEFMAYRPDLSGSYEITRLREANVKPIDILAEACAVTLLYWKQDQPGATYKFFDDNHYMVSMGWRCLMLVPRETRTAASGKTHYREPGGRARRRMGEWLWQTLGPLLVNTAKHIMTREAREEKAREIYQTPLT